MRFNSNMEMEEPVSDGMSVIVQEQIYGFQKIKYE